MRHQAKLGVGAFLILFGGIGVGASDFASFAYWIANGFIVGGAFFMSEIRDELRKR